MDKLSWLTNLKKTTVDTLPNYKAPATPNVEKQFQDLVKVDDLEGDAATVTTKVFATDPDDSDVPDPVGLSIKKESNARNRIPEFTAPEPHADGEATSITGSATWTRTYAAGELVKSMTNDPALPGRKMFFDARGFEISRAEYLTLDRAAAPDLVIETSLAKLCGLRPEDQGEMEELPSLGAMK